VGGLAATRVKPPIFSVRRNEKPEKRNEKPKNPENCLKKGNRKEK
jgi:hypothetical protein